VTRTPAQRWWMPSIGARLSITLGSRFSVAASKSRYWVPIWPHTGIARLIARMNALLNERLYDRAYVERYTTGNRVSSSIRHGTPPQRIGNIITHFNRMPRMAEFQ
jgi:anaerobic selenocysteine-containing dehydrogenase